jgi:hypothetical protein
MAWTTLQPSGAGEPELREHARDDCGLGISRRAAGGVSVVSRELNTTYYEHYYLGFVDGNYRWFVNTSSGYSDTSLGSAAPLGQWIHVAGTYDGASVKLYVNGALQFTTSHTGTFSSDTTGITIGASHNDKPIGYRGFNGAMTG